MLFRSFFMAPAFAWFRGPDDLNWLRPEEGRVIQVVDEHGRECPPGVQGLVRIRLREFDVQSYIEDEQATARAFRDGFCYPGDLGVMRADGRVRLLGRDGDVINIAGQKIPAALIEEGLHGALRVEEVCVFAGPLDSGGQELVIALKTDRDPPPYELAPLAREFESFERVRVAVFEAFPKNVSGMRKTSRPELRKLAFAAARQIAR